jgi:hypothetical protein
MVSWAMASVQDPAQQKIFQQLLEITGLSEGDRTELIAARNTWKLMKTFVSDRSSLRLLNTKLRCHW